MKLLNPEVRIETTNICNASCSICPRDKMTRPKATMPPEHFRELADQVASMGAKEISPFGYGEPLLDEHIAEHVEYITGLGLRSFITTNASMLNTTMIFALLSAGLSHIRFSVHGLGDSYERMHGFKFSRIMQNIFNFTATVKKRGYDCKTDVSVIPQDDEKERVITFWTDKVDDIEIWKAHNWADEKSFRDNSDVRMKTCGRPDKGPVQINADGKMMVCCFDFDAKLTVGDTYKDSIEDILHGEEFRRIRKKHRTGNLGGLVCDTCDQLNIGDNPLIYSTIDKELRHGRTSSTKFRLLG